MTKEKYLITGALGCLGAWVIRNLVQDWNTTCCI